MSAPTSAPLLLAPSQRAATNTRRAASIPSTYAVTRATPSEEPKSIITPPCSQNGRRQPARPRGVDTGMGGEGLRDHDAGIVVVADRPEASPEDQGTDHGLDGYEGDRCRSRRGSLACVHGEPGRTSRVPSYSELTGAAGSVGTFGWAGAAGLTGWAGAGGLTGWAGGARLTGRAGARRDGLGRTLGAHRRGRLGWCVRLGRRG